MTRSQAQTSSTVAEAVSFIVVSVRRWFVFLFLGAVLLSGCGDDDEETPAQPAPKPPQARAEAAVLTLADLPAGWKAFAEADRPDHGPTFEALASCLGVQDPDQDAVGAAMSPTFVAGLATQVTSKVAYSPSPERAREVASAYTGDKFTGCAQQAFAGDVTRNAPPGATAKDVQVAPLEFPPLGDSTAAHRVTATIEIMGGSLPLFMDFVAVFEGEAVSRLVFLNPGSPFPAELQRSLTEKVVTRASS